MSLIDFAIITALPEEFAALQKLLPNLAEDKQQGNPEVWYRTRLEGVNGASYSIVAAFQTQMGPLQASVLTSKIIERWDPSYIILIGIAGSFHKEVKLADVIVSQQVFYYDPGKVTEGDIEYRPEGYPCSVTLVRQAQALSLDNSAFNRWQLEANQSATAKARASGAKSSMNALRVHSPAVHFGTVASGSLVIASKKKQAKLLSLHGKIIGTEMEGAGLLHETFAREIPTPAIVVKGISDHADSGKARADEKKYWRELAAENAARFALSLIRRGRIRPLHTDEFVLDVTRSPLEIVRERIPDPSAAGIQLLGFSRLVCPTGPLTSLSIAVNAFGDGEAVLPIQKLVVDYVRRDGEHVAKPFTAGNEIVLSGLAAEPLQVYLSLIGVAQQIHFAVRSPTQAHEIIWRLSS
jgi:nucleoside phosphorylase